MGVIKWIILLGIGAIVGAMIGGVIYPEAGLVIGAICGAIISQIVQGIKTPGPKYPGNKNY
ncbi:MAG: hypothetical protein ACXAC8_18540 [Candidatus Hodarchaeales archaeon]|jgi:hypothetical protein